MPDDSLSVGVLVFDEKDFSCVNPDTDKLISEGMKYSYENIEKIVMRSRHEHMDIRFRGSQPRFRLMSSYLQIITNEIVLRTPKGQVEVIFEPNVEKFEYGNPKITVPSPTARKTHLSGFFNREQTSTSSLLSNEVDEQTKKDMDETDKHLDEISDLLGNFGVMNNQMNRVITQQTEKLDRINDKTDIAIHKLEKQNKQIDRLIDT